MDAMERLVRILATTVPAFLAREKPISRNAKPACMKNTSRAASTTQVVSIAALGRGDRGLGARGAGRGGGVGTRRQSQQQAARQGKCSSVHGRNARRPPR